MLHDVALHDVIGRHQAYIQRKKDLFIYAHRILHLAKTTRVHVMHARFVHDEIINSVCSQPLASLE